MDENNSIEIIAYHEAGKAVMCRLVGNREIVDVTIKPEKNLGEIKYEPRHWVSDHETNEIMKPEVWVELVRDAKIGYAGEQTQILKFGHMEASPDASIDYMVFFGIICTDTERDQLIRDVEALLEDNWAKVDTVAKALLEKNTLSGQEVAEIIANKN